MTERSGDTKAPNLTLTHPMLPGDASVHVHIARTVVPYSFLLLALLIYFMARTTLLSIASGSGAGCLALDAAVFIVASAFVSIRHNEIPAPVRMLMRGIGAVVLIQLVFDAGNLILDSPGTGSRFFQFGTALGLLSGILALWRPAFVLPLFFHYVAFRRQIGVVTGIEISETDYLSMLDIGTFVTIGTLTAVVGTKERFWPHSGLATEADRLALRRAACSLIWGCAVGAHLGNYFISAWTKIRAGGAEPLFWLLHNPTQTSILIGLERGDNPLATWPAAVQFSWDAIVGGGIVVNAFVLGSQIASPAALMTRRWLMAFVLLFDLFHVGVYFTLGALFFFWIAVNTLIYFSAKRLRDDEFIWPMRAVALLAVGLGHFVFYTSHLGWLDGAKLASPGFVAESSDGALAAIPSSYFGIASYSIAQTVMFVPDDFFPLRIGGNTYNVRDWRDSQACGPAMADHQETGVTLQAVTDLVRQTDAAMRRHPVVKALNLFYFYPHHMVPNPFMFRPFNNLRIEDIVRYHYVVESVCLGLREGLLVRNIRKRYDHVIDVR